MVQRSTWVILVGIVLVFWPIPPLATTALGALVVVLGAILRILDG